MLFSFSHKQPTLGPSMFIFASFFLVLCETRKSMRKNEKARKVAKSSSAELYRVYKKKKKLMSKNKLKKDELFAAQLFSHWPMFTACNMSSLFLLCFILNSHSKRRICFPQSHFVKIVVLKDFRLIHRNFRFEL